MSDAYKKYNNALMDIMKSESGRTFIYMLLDMLGAETPLYYNGQSEAFAFVAGRRSVADELIGAIRKLDNGLELEKKMRHEARAEPETEGLESDFDKMIGGEGLAD